MDGLRGIAVLLVLLGHFQLTEWGVVGVDVFFALSGFLITTLLYEEWQRGGRIGLLRAKALSVVGKDGKLIDPMTYVGKALRELARED
ncbi:acyltransferase family protein [Streptomyces sp. NPDC053542]|uniref:acyltransferase family protein n=1 Tax=Streptomyces sp. NPDC053542 TaxID=3365710 RepID=UPI0037D6AE64